MYVLPSPNSSRHAEDRYIGRLIKYLLRLLLPRRQKKQRKIAVVIGDVAFCVYVSMYVCGSPRLINNDQVG